jgi:hypothetical protein
VKLLVGMLSCGENERSRSIEALKRQSFRTWDFFEIRDRPNKEAHVQLYRTFMASGADCYLKLDADMVLKADVLGELVEATKAQDISMVYVDDWASRMSIPGMQIFSSHCRWEDDGDPLNVDTTPRHRGKQFLRDARWVDHMPDPGEFQAFRYGVHKALKVLQTGAATRIPEKVPLHFGVLKGIWRHRKEDARRELMILGAECVFSGKHPQLAENYAGDYARRLLDEVKGADVERFAPLWEAGAADRRLRALVFQVQGTRPEAQGTAQDPAGRT